jgi:hypothetical protein
MAANFVLQVGGVNPMFFPLGKGSQFDSWLSVGIVNGESASALGTLGIDFKSWSKTRGLSTSDGAVFWMSPYDGPSVSALHPYADSVHSSVPVRSPGSSHCCCCVRPRTATGRRATASPPATLLSRS